MPFNTVNPYALATRLLPRGIHIIGRTFYTLIEIGTPYFWSLFFYVPTCDLFVVVLSKLAYLKDSVHPENESEIVGRVTAMPQV